MSRRFSSSLAVLCALLIPLTSALSQIEAVQREIQKRRRWLPGADWTWPLSECNSGTAPGPMPPDGFYADGWSNPTCASVLVDHAASALGGLLQSIQFLPPENQNLEGKSGFTDRSPPNGVYWYVYDDFNIPHIIDETNYLGALQAIQTAVAKLNIVMEVSPHLTDGRDFARHPHGGSSWFACGELHPPPDCCDPEDGTECCDTGFSRWEADVSDEWTWNQNPNSRVRYYEAHIVAKNLKVATQDCLPEFIGDQYFETAKAKAAVQGGRLSYQVMVYARVVPQSIGADGVGPHGPTIGTDGNYHALVAGAGQGPWKSGYVTPFDFPQGDVRGSYSQHCEDYPIVGCDDDGYFWEVGWDLDSMLLAVLRPNWDEGADTGIGPGFPPQVETNTPLGEGGACGDCLGSESGSEANGSTGVPDGQALQQRPSSEAGVGPAVSAPADVINCGTGGALPTTTNTVNLADGAKIESADDIVLSILGRTFRVSREYSSRPDYGGPGLVGVNWTMSVFQFLFPNPHLSDNSITIEAWPARYKSRFTNPGGGPIWTMTGPSAQELKESHITLAGIVYDTWKLVEPGSWERHYYRSGEEHDHPPEMNGLILCDIDTFGNTCSYLYAMLGPEGQQYPRLTHVMLDAPAGAGLDSAMLEFAWNLSDPNRGRLNEIRAYQRDASGTLTLVQRAAYTYKSGTADHEGMLGDLVQVTRHVAVDKKPSDSTHPYRTLVTQYRYHRAGVQPPPGQTDERLTTQGMNHQLRMVFHPEQIEFMARELNFSTQPQQWTDDAALAAAAAVFRGLPDENAIYAGAAHRVVDFAAKIVSYETRSSSFRTAAQFLQSGCGCSGNSQGTKQVYSYLGTVDLPTVKVQQYVLPEGSGDYSQLHATTYYDMKRMPAQPTDDDSPYIINVALLEAAPPHRRWVWRTEYLESRDTAKVIMPSAVTDYQAVDEGELQVDVSANEGLVIAYAYSGGHRLQEVRVCEGNSAEPNDYRLLRRTSYDLQSRPFLPTKIEVFPTDSESDESVIETTTYSYGFHDLPDDNGHLDLAHERWTRGEYQVKPASNRSGLT